MTRKSLERPKITKRYVDVVHALGALNVDGASLRTRMMVDGVDFWAASLVRESSPWRPGFFERLAALENGDSDRNSESLTIPSDWRIKAKTIWHCFASLAAGVLNRGESMQGDVVFVGYMPADSKGLSDVDAISRYFGDLPRHVESMGHRVSALFLPIDSPVARMSRIERRSLSSMHRTMCSPALTSFLTVRTVTRGIRTWCRLQRSLSSWRRLKKFEIQSADLAKLMPLLSKDLHESLGGTASLRVALLDAGFSAALTAKNGPKLVIYPYEGQGWEVCLETVCQRLKIPSIAYLHTIVKPWDVRAHTGLREASPRVLALHGPYDRNELGDLACRGVSVEALRYGYLGESRPNRNMGIDTREVLSVTGDATEKRMLVVLGSDCTDSTMQLNQLLAELAINPRGWKIFVKPHPQCSSMNFREESYEVVESNLSAALQTCNAVFLCGTAAPLDSYLSAIPTACLVEPRGYSMNPLEPDDLYFVGKSIEEILNWFEGAISKTFLVPNASRFFDLDSGLKQWHDLISRILSTSHG